MRLTVLKERRAHETRVAATPETTRKLTALGLTVVVETGAGAGASIPDADFTAAGAEIAPDARTALTGAGIVFAVQPPEDLAVLPRGTLLVCTAGAMADRDSVPAYAKAGIDVAAMELLPRITRAQSMDILSSQANLAGYRAVIEGAGAFDRGFPMMMTAAGTVPPARVFVIGAGVAGLQAIATARRLGAIVSATDVRPAAKEEIKSLGASFVGVEDTETAGQTGAYAKEMSTDFRRKQAELMAATVAKNDMVICTALVQGGRAPVLVTQAMVDAMKPGSVVVDLAADGGGNCEATRPGEAYTTERGVKVLGYRNWPGRIPVAASTLYAKNLLTFLTSFWDKEAGAPKLPADDVIVQGVMLTRGGQMVHASFAPAGAQPATGGQADAPAASKAPAEEHPSAASTPQPDAAAAQPPAADEFPVEKPSAQEHPSAASAMTPGARDAASPGEPAAAPGPAFSQPEHEAASLPRPGTPANDADPEFVSSFPEPTVSGVYGEAASAGGAALSDQGEATLPPGDGMAPHAPPPSADQVSASVEPTASGVYGEALSPGRAGTPHDANTDDPAPPQHEHGGAEAFSPAYGDGLPSAADEGGAPPQHEHGGTEAETLPAYGEGLPETSGAARTAEDGSDEEVAPDPAISPQAGAAAATRPKGGGGGGRRTKGGSRPRNHHVPPASRGAGEHA